MVEAVALKTWTMSDVPSSKMAVLISDMLVSSVCRFYIWHSASTVSDLNLCSLVSVTDVIHAHRMLLYRLVL